MRARDLSLSAVTLSLLPGAAEAATATVTVTLPQPKVAEYHRPYVAMWLEAAGKPAQTVALWYDGDNRENGGTKWLADLRSWWRKGGRSLKLPADGITGATRAPGPNRVAFAAGKAPWGNLAPGAYTLNVEAAREVGGREVVSVPFQWPPKGPQVLAAQGKTELSAVSLDIKP